MRGMREGQQQGRLALRCRHCGEPVRRAGTGYGTVETTVHAGSGAELCADGLHVAAPTATGPVMHAQAVEAESGSGQVIATDLGMFRVCPWGVFVLMPVTASGPGGLREPESADMRAAGRGMAVAGTRS